MFRYLVILIGFCLLCYSAFGYWQRINPSQLSFAEFTPVASVSARLKPSEIKVGSVGISLPVIPTKITNGRWQTVSDGVSYLTESAQPGEIGNAVFYGHNWARLLGKLPKVRPGDKIDVVFEDKTVRSFRVEYTSVISPTQTQILRPTDDRRITIYTCTGLLDSQRFVAVALAI